MQQQQQPPKQRNASQRLDDLERGLMALYHTADNMARDIMTIKEAIKLLGNKLDAVVKASSRGENLNDEVIAKIMVENNVEELKQKVTNLVNQGVLVAAEEISLNSFVVGKEIGDDGSVANPRMQFVVSALQPEVRDKFPGAKVGQTLDLQEGKWKFTVDEIYAIVTPQAPEAVTEESATDAKAEATEQEPKAEGAATATQDAQTESSDGGQQA